MEVILVFSLPVLIGAILAALLRFLRRKLDSALNWPLLFFLAVLGAAANNTAAVFFAWAGCFFPSNGGFFGGDNLTAALSGLLLLLFSVPGILVCATAHKTGRRPNVVSGWSWGWVMGQAALSALIFVLGLYPTFRILPTDAGIPMPVFEGLLALICPLLGFLLSRRMAGQGRGGVLIPIVGTVMFCAVSALLILSMLGQAADPTSGGHLIQSVPGLWYSRLNLPAALLLGDYQYAWHITPPGLLLSALSPSLLFLLGWLGALWLKPSETRQVP